MFAGRKSALISAVPSVELGMPSAVDGLEKVAARVHRAESLLANLRSIVVGSQDAVS